MAALFQNKSECMEEFFLKIPQVTMVLRTVLRYLLPILSVLILVRTGVSLLAFRREPEIWAWLSMPNGQRLSVTHWESTIGRAKSCDISIQYPTVSRLHAVLTRYDDGSWTVSDAGSKGGVTVDGEPVSVGEIRYGQTVSLAGVEFTLVPITREQELAQAEYRTRPGLKLKPWVTLSFLSLFQLLLTLSLLLSVDKALAVVVSMGGLCALQWLLLGFYTLIRRTAFEVETAAFFLSSLCLSVIVSSAPDEVYKQLICVFLGIITFLLVGWCLRDLNRAKFLRYLAAVGGIGLLLCSMLFGTEVNGAKNWIYLGGISVQPSELAKICFVFVWASSLDRLVTKRNLLLFLVYTGVVCVCLAILSDFGTALIFFVAFLVIAFMRSGNFAALGLVTGGVGFAGMLAARFLPYIKRRFAVWGHVWENALTSGYQQTRAMMCIASGGLFGLGAGQGWLKYVAASDTDLVFAFVSEEYGLIMAFLAVLTVVLLAVFAVRASAMGRSSFYTIGACAAASILVTQTILNVFGTVDLLPLTGVTFPFLSNGGSGTIAVWGLLAFLKSADTRQNASFAIKLPRLEGGAE